MTQDLKQGLLVWWTPNDIIQNKTGWPEYIKAQYDSRRGRNGRGRLWVDRQFGEVAIEPWPETPFAEYIGEYMGGIVIRAEDADIVKSASGVVTDLSLNIVHVCSGGMLSSMVAWDILEAFK